MKRLIISLILLAVLLTACTETPTEQDAKDQMSSEDRAETSVAPTEEEVQERKDNRKPAPRQPATGDAIIADHFAAAAFEDIPACWIEEAKEDIVMGYGHTSHGSQITSGLSALNRLMNSKGSEENLYAIGGNGMDIEEGGSYNEGWLDHDVGYGGWDTETREYLDASEHDDVNAIMWSWCGQVGSVDLDSHYLDNAVSLEDEYGDVTFIYMTGHLDGSGPEGNVEKANDRIREHVTENGGVLFDFADIESYDPDGNYYPDESDACNWCSEWCDDHPEDCENLPGCAHSHGFNCMQKAKAFWWMAARMAGWDGSADDRCP